MFKFSTVLYVHYIQGGLKKIIHFWAKKIYPEFVANKIHTLYWISPVLASFKTATCAFLFILEVLCSQELPSSVHLFFLCAIWPKNHNPGNGALFFCTRKAKKIHTERMNFFSPPCIHA